jgi:hypothetical protein
MDILFSYTGLLKDKQNEDIVYPLLEQIANTGLVDDQIRKENARALKRIEDLGERPLAREIRKRYPNFI